MIFLIEESSTRAKADKSEGGEFVCIVFCVCVVCYVCFVFLCVAYVFDLCIVFWDCVFSVFVNIVVVESSGHAKAGDAEEGVVVFVLLW